MLVVGVWQWWIVALFALVWALWAWKRRRNLVPGPTGLPFIGHLHLLDPARPYVSLAAMADTHGPLFRIRLGRLDTIVLASPRLIRHTLARPEFTARADLFLTHGIMQGYGIIVAEGERWKEQRKFVINWLKTIGMVKIGAKRAQLEAKILNGVAEAIKLIDETELSTDKVLLHSMGNILNLLVLGRRWDYDDPTWQWLQHLAEQGVKLIGVAGPLNFLPFLRWLPYYQEKLNFVLEGKNKTHELYRELIWNGDKPKQELEKDCLTVAFIEEMANGDKHSFTEKQLYHLVADLWGAGVDTTLTTVRWFLLFMAIHPEIQEKIVTEMSSKLNGREPVLDDMTDLPYLEACILETQRIRPVTPLGIPHANNMDADIGGHYIPKGTMIIPLLWAVHMDPKAWTEPEKFNPERFIDGNREIIRPTHFMPFQTGKRACAGEEMARMMLWLFCSRLICRYRIALGHGEDDLDTAGECGITLTPPSHRIVFTRR